MTKKKKITKKIEIPVEDNPNFVRDSFSKGIINKDRNKYIQRVKQRQLIKSNADDKKSLEKRLNRLEGMMEKILEKLG